MSHIDRTKPICVTGASGFIATHLVEQLLEKGYKVRGTVRDNSPEGLKKYEYLTNLAGAKENLTFYQVSYLIFMFMIDFNLFSFVI